MLEENLLETVQNTKKIERKNPNAVQVEIVRGSPEKTLKKSDLKSASFGILQSDNEDSFFVSDHSFYEDDDDDSYH